MFVADTINFREIVMKEPLPLATIQNAVIDFLRGRDDVVLFGAQAVNVYVAARQTEIRHGLARRGVVASDVSRIEMRSRPSHRLFECRESRPECDGYLARTG